MTGILGTEPLGNMFLSDNRFPNNTQEFLSLQGILEMVQMSNISKGAGQPLWPWSLGSVQVFLYWHSSGSQNKAVWGYFDRLTFLLSQGNNPLPLPYKVGWGEGGCSSELGFKAKFSVGFNWHSLAAQRNSSWLNKTQGWEICLDARSMQLGCDWNWSITPGLDPL